MASVYDLDELVQLVALHFGDYGNLGRIYQLWTTYICTYTLVSGTRSVSNIIVKGFLRKWLSG